MLFFMHQGNMQCLQNMDFFGCSILPVAAQVEQHEFVELQGDTTVADAGACALQALLMGLDMPLDAETVTTEELKNFTIRTFGMGKVPDEEVKHITPIFPPDSLFLRRFKQAVGGDVEEADAWDVIAKTGDDLHDGLEPSNEKDGEVSPRTSE